MWLLACAAPSVPTGPTPIYDPGSDAFFDAPWPDDARRDPDGTLALANFPNPLSITLVDTYLETAETLSGFGTSSPIYVRFDGPFDPASLPTPEESVLDGSPLLLVDLASRERTPVQWEQTTYDGSPWAPPDLLAVAPLHGWALEGGRQYALVVTTEIARPNERWRREPMLPALEDALKELDLKPDDVAIATVFTTQDPVGEMADIAWFVRNQIELPDFDVTLEHLEDHDTYTAYRTHYLGPVFTQGVPPYTVEGGEFSFDEEGRPVVARFDDMRVAVCVPNEGAPPPSGWPVVIFQHGTGGDYRGFCDDDFAYEVMTRFGAAGLVGIGIDQPLHGSRPGGDFATDINHFNILNPTSARTNFRQGALDAIFLARGLASRPWTMETQAGDAVPLDPDNVLFMGHSQGGLTGALATPFFAGDVRASMISGAGGVLAITIVERKDPFDFGQLVRDLLQFDDAEALTPLHPVLGLVQTMVDVTDPVNYAPYWFSRAAPWTDAAPTDVLLTSGTADAATPYRTAIALAAAGALPQVGPPATDAEAVRMRTGAPAPLPRSETVTRSDGSVGTAGFVQFLGGTHFVVFEEPEASNLAVNFLETAAEESPELTTEPR